MSPKSQPRHTSVDTNSPAKSWLSERPILSLSVLFAAWKLLLLSIISLSPGPGYDTSSDHLISRSSPSYPSIALSHLTTRLLRWDAIFFTSSARHGHSYEHEWAFSWPLSQLIKLVTESSFDIHASPSDASSESQTPAGLERYVLVGALISLIAHYGSAMILYHIVRLVTARARRRSNVTTTTLSSDTNLAVLVSLLHTISPAGVFLVSSYGEALFSFLSFLGAALFLHATTAESGSCHTDALFLLSGLVWGVATLIRSNGLFAGVAYVCCGFTTVLVPATSLLRAQPSMNPSVTSWIPLIRRTVILGLSSLSILAGFVFPQWLAYRDFCQFGTAIPAPEWCHYRIPAIYTYIQARYWNVGFLRYWTPANIPLFLLAAPTLFFLFSTTLTIIRLSLKSGINEQEGTPSHIVGMATSLLPLALVQAVLALLAVTNYHIQIITRLASGYPVWYIFIGLAIQSGSGNDQDMTNGNIKRLLSLPVSSRTVVGWMVFYGVIQAALFASFLPPA